MKYTFDLSRALSWSAISSFEWDKEQWFRAYILKEKQSSPEMDFGSFADKKLQTDPSFLPEVPRYPHMQYMMEVMFGKIRLKGIPDGICFDKFILADYKTGKKKWDKKRADESGQLTMYLLLIYITTKVKPEKFKCFIHWLPTKDNGDFTISLKEPFVLHTFETKRTMADLLEFGVRIKKVYEEMQKYVAFKNGVR